ncbi:MAG TPA: DUF177 domain-containing protein [Terriglobales bacterium]|nr:DUF177 domain-containing protein [Terriglobales bacterium]
MFIDIRELELHRLDFDETFQPEVIDFGADVRQRTPLVANGHAELLKEHHGGSKGEVIEDIRLVGSLATSIETACARCLEPVRTDLSRDFDLLYRPQGADAGQEELSVTQAEAEIGYYSGDGLQLEDVLREQVLLAVPLRVLCGEACKGLCPQCGKNLNVEACSCESQQSDPRWDALKNIKI